MKFSLVTATFGRVSEFEKLLQSLSSQTFKDFELIVIDQNEHRELEKICNSFKNLNVKYIRSDKKGLSLNRNIGLKYAIGEIIGFPDDDCYYDDNLLENVAEKFEKLPDYKLVAVEAKDTKSDKIHRKKCNIHRRNLLSACVSFNFFIRKYTDMLFDEDFGVGTYFGSGEETDFIWEYFSTDDSGVFAENTFVYHPYGNLDSQKRYKYGLGNGAIYKKEICGRKHYMMFFNFCYSLFRSIVGMFFLKQREPHYAALKGKIKGFLEYQIQK